MLTACIIIGIIILLIEATLWHTFKRKAAGVSFPRETDQSYFRFFSVNRMRLLAIAHTIFLLTILGVSALFLW